MQIKFDEWQIRSFRADDAPALAKHGNNRAVWRNIWDKHPYPYGVADAEEWIQYAMQQDPETTFAIASGDEAIGTIGFLPQADVARLSAEIGYWLGEPFWGRGITTGAVKALTEHAFAEFEFVRLYATVMVWNPASARVLEKSGYRYEGLMRQSAFKDGEIIDQWLYATVREPRPVPDERSRPGATPSQTGAVGK